jgi:hypothetical protein
MERDEAGQARSLSAAWALAAAGLRKPDEHLSAALADTAFLGEAETALAALDPGDAEGLRGAWVRFRLVVSGGGRQGLELERARVLGEPVSSPYLPFELEYRAHYNLPADPAGPEGADSSPPALAVQAAIESREREDRVAGQAEHLSLLALKRAAADERGEAECVAFCRIAERRFLEDHLGRSLPSFARHVEEREPAGALAAAARLAEGTARVHAEAVGARMGRPDKESRGPGEGEADDADPGMES